MSLDLTPPVESLGGTLYPGHSIVMAMPAATEWPATTRLTLAGVPAMPTASIDEVEGKWVASWTMTAAEVTAATDGLSSIAVEVTIAETVIGTGYLRVQRGAVGSGTQWLTSRVVYLPGLGGGGTSYPEIQSLTLTGPTVITAGMAGTQAPWPTDQVVGVRLVRESAGAVTLASSIKVASGVTWSVDATLGSETMAVFAYGPSGWVCEGCWLSVPGTGGSGGGGTVVQVTPTGPTWTDDATNGGGAWTTPAQTGLTYSPAGTNQAASAGSTVTWTVTAQSGYAIAEGSPESWSHTFPTATAESFTLAYVAGSDVPNISGSNTIYTIPTVQLGAAASSRRIIVATVGRKASPSAAASSVTVAGIAATKVAEVLDSGTTTSIWSANVPTGTTGSVVSVWPEAMVRCHMHVYRVTGSASGIVDSKQATGSAAATLNLTTATGGGIIATSVSTTGSATATWTGGVAQDSKIGPTMPVSAASGLTSATSTPVGVTWTSNGQAHLAVSLAPAI